MDMSHMAATVTVTATPELEKFVKNLKDSIGTKKLEVGFLDSENATKAAKNEFGGVFEVDQEYKDRAKKKGVILGDYISIPPRPFMRSTVKAKKQSWAQTAKKALLSTEYDVDKSLGILGLKMQTDIQDTIRDGSWISNGENTIEIKGFDKPLIDTGVMLQNVTYEVTS